MAQKAKLEPLGWPLIRLALVVVIGGIAPLIDTTVVNVALHTMSTNFHVSTLIFPFVGKLSDNIGRRKVLLYNGVAIALLCAGAFATLAAGWWSGFAAILILAFIVRFSGVGVFAVVPAYLCECFPPATRSSGYGLGYSAPLLITSFYAYYQNGLAGIMPRDYTPSILLVIGGALVICAALLGPETLDRIRSSSGSPSTAHRAAEVGRVVQDSP